MDQRDRDVLSVPREREADESLPALRRLALGFCALAVALTLHLRAAAETARLVPTGVEATPGRYAPAASSQDAEVRRRGAEIDGTVAGALEDMGLDVVPAGANAPADGDLASMAAGDWAFAPRFELRSGGALVRIVAVSPGSRVLLVREEEVEGNDLQALSVRTVVMVRDIVEAGRSKRIERTAHTEPTRVHKPPPPPRSSGRAVLALNAALYGGYLGFATQRASGSDDSRLVYPMVALGAGLGLGASLLVADEWNISEADAWYLAAGAYWPGASGYLIAEGYGSELEDRFLYGLMGATTGIGLGTVALATGDLGDGGAVLTHSGGAFGMLFGAMAEVAIEGTSSETPTRGMGFGTGAGVLAAGIAATQVDIPASRMLLLDLSVSLGGLGGAAIGSPLLFVEDPEPIHTRLWLGAVTAGAIAGGVIGWYATDKDGAPKEGAELSGLRVLPYASYDPARRGGASMAGVMGTF
jgi:hypothetical protein